MDASARTTPHGSEQVNGPQQVRVHRCPGGQSALEAQTGAAAHNSSWPQRDPPSVVVQQAQLLPAGPHRLDGKSQAAGLGQVTGVTEAHVQVTLSTADPGGQVMDSA